MPGELHFPNGLSTIALHLNRARAAPHPRVQTAQLSLTLFDLPYSPSRPPERRESTWQTDSSPGSRGGGKSRAPFGSAHPRVSPHLEAGWTNEASVEQEAGCWRSQPSSGRTCDRLRLLVPRPADSLELGGIVAWEQIEQEAGLTKSLTFSSYSRETYLTDILSRGNW